MRAVAAGTALVCAGLAAAYAAQGRTLTIDVGDLKAPGFEAQSVRARLTGAKLQDLTLDIGRLAVAGRTFLKAKLACPEAELTAARIACPRGVLEAEGKFQVSFSYLTERRELAAELKPSADETVRIAARFDGKTPAIEARLERARMDRLAPWLPPGVPKLSAGRASGTLSAQGDAYTARLDIEGLGFTDASGLHAGEKIAATIEADATQGGGDWQWRTRLLWRSGEVFWQPFFLAAKGHRLEAQGSTARGVTTLESGRVELPGVATIALKGEWNHAKGALTVLEASAPKVAVGPLYTQVLKPMLAGTALAELRSEGALSFTARMGPDGLTALDLVLDNVSFDDRDRRFAVFGLSGRVPWRRDDATRAEIEWKGGELMKMSIGRARIPMRLKGLRVDIDEARIPVLDGALTLHDFAIGMARSGWRWRFSADIAPISMVQLTEALGLPLMHGSLGGRVPEMRYRRQTLDMDGELGVRVFDGTVRATRLQLIDPFGLAPRMHADLEMKNLDLELLTRAFDFGTITGRADARISGLELVAWTPVRFDARIESSEGSYPRKISQRAVQNISALGGAGAAAAIQRSLLRFFDEFGYARLGLSCRLQDAVCHMDGIERAPQGFVIVKGGGVPAISVIGYNRSIDWRELVARLKRITQDNVKPIVK